MESIETGLIRMVLGLASNREALVTALQELWPAIVGKDLARVTSPSGLEKGLLTIDVADPDWSDHLRSFREMLLSRIQVACGEPLVTRIRFKTARP